MTIITSASGLLAMLSEDQDALKVHALKNLNILVDQFWAEISASISTIESLYEDEEFEQRELAALLASKVFYHLGELNDSLTYALGAGTLFDISAGSEYVRTLIAKCIDEYVGLASSLAAGGEHGGGEEVEVDPRLVSIVERMMDKCISDGELQQAVGLALECHRLDKLEEAVAASTAPEDLLGYCLRASRTLIHQREFRQQVLRTLISLYQKSPSPDYVSICQCLMFLNDAPAVAGILDTLLRGSQDDVLLAYQVSFDLFENEMPQFLLHVRELLPDPRPPPQPQPTQQPQQQREEAATAAVSAEATAEATAAEATAAEATATDATVATDAGEAVAAVAGTQGGAMEATEATQTEVAEEKAEEGPTGMEGVEGNEGGEKEAVVAAGEKEEGSVEAEEGGEEKKLDDPSPAAVASEVSGGVDPPTAADSSQAAEVPEGTPAMLELPTLSPEEIRYAEQLAKLKGILSGETPISLTLQFLYSRNKADLLILKHIKQSVESRNSVCHGATIAANAFMHAGTTVDTFLRENLDWLSRATNWAKFSATAGLGVIHKGHLQQGRSLMAPYLPQGGASTSAYSEGGALYALGLIHANHGEGIRNFLLESLCNTSSEPIQHGASLGLGLATMGTCDEEVYEDLKSVLYTDSATAGEAAGIGMGLLLAGSGSERAGEMLAYAHDTQHEKIIRGLSLGISLVVYGREQEADTLIHQMTSDQDPILRYGGMYAIAMAYHGTANNAAVRQLLHHAVSDVSDDVRRAAVTSLGFVLCSEPEQVPRIVSLLSESYNPHVRYGAAMAVGIACAGSGLRSAVDLLEPLTSDVTDFARQGALIAMAMVLVQVTEEREPRVAKFRRQLEKIAADKHEDTMSKMGAIIAAGILDAGGRNMTIRLRSRAGYDRMTAVMGMAVFSQFWYWYPLVFFLSLSFSATAFIGLQSDLRAPKLDIACTAKPGLFGYPPPADANKEAKGASKAPVAMLSTAAAAAAKAKAKAKKEAAAAAAASGTTAAGEKAEAKANSADVTMGEVEGASATAAKGDEGAAAAPAVAAADAPAAEAMDVEGDQSAAKKGSEKVTTELLPNPARVIPGQEDFVALPKNCRYTPLKKKLSGFVLLKDNQPDSPEEFVLSDGAAGHPAAPAPAAPATAGHGSEEEPPPPEAFEFVQ